VAAQSHGRTKVFISYSHQDDVWLQRLRVHLKPLEREHRIEIWDDTVIKSGSNWKEEIGQALDATRVAVLLVSADFLASEFIASNELPLLLSAAKKEGAIILPVILSPSRFERSPNLAQFQAVNDPSRPLVSLAKGEQEAILVKVSEAIEGSLNHSPETVAEHGEKGETARIHKPWKPKRDGKGESSGAVSRMPKESRRRKLPKMHPTIWVAILGGIVALVTGYWQFVYKPAHPDGTSQYMGRVTDQISQRAIRGAKLSVEAQGVPQVYYTDSDGIVHLQLRSLGDTVRIRVEADGYEFFDRNVSLSRDIIEDVRLTPINVSPPQPSPTTVPAISVNKNDNRSPAGTNSTARRKPGINSASDLEERKQQAREDLNYRSPTPEP
jgi:hypothetical protein